MTWYDREHLTGDGNASLEQRPFLGGHLVERIELRIVIFLWALHHGHGTISILPNRVDGSGVFTGQQGRKHCNSVALAIALAVAHRWHEGYMLAVAIFSADNV